MVDLLESAILLIPHLYRSVLSARRSLMTKLAEILFYRYVDVDVDVGAALLGESANLYLT